ncbi:MAG: histidinol-phosphatase HisJ family protein [Chloroflexota bacterium]
MKLLHDYHVHSLFSGDNDTPMEDMCHAAIARGIAEICFTEHFDVNAREPLRYQFPLETWANELARCRRLFAGRLVIRAGLELSEPHTDPEPVEKLLASYPFDLIIASVHWVGNEIIFDPAYFKRPADEAYRMYFAEVEKMTRQETFANFDVLGHLDIAARKGYEVYGAYDPARYEDLIRPILANCIRNAIALDINAACINRPLGRLTPDLDILRWYVEMGGERVIFSSDAHNPGQMGANLERALSAGKAAGIRRTLRYTARNAEWVALYS